MGQYTAQGIAYVTCEWTLTGLQFLVVLVRLYSRVFLTRSVGSDDFFIAIASCLLWVCTVIDFESFLHGLAQHEDQLSESQMASYTYWSTISFFVVYITFFLIRVSVALFVLRLLPSYKIVQRRIIYGVILVNFAISAYANISYGLSCRPLKANWDTTITDAKCFSKRALVITSQINAALSCACDVATALVPQFLLWKVQMTARTKRHLTAIFYLGLITAALSIGRAATTTETALTEDTTWKLMPSYFFSLFELELGTIFACGPALRQFLAYHKRAKTFLPTDARQYPNQDFERMRYRINLRDVMWYRQAKETGGRIFDGHSMFTSGTSSPPGAREGRPTTAPEVSKSILDVWQERIARLFGRRKSSPHRPSSLKPLQESDSNDSRPSGVVPEDSSRSDDNGTMPKAGKLKGNDSASMPSTFLISNSAGGSHAHLDDSEPMSPAQDIELANELADPKLLRSP